MSTRISCRNFSLWACIPICFIFYYHCILLLRTYCQSYFSHNIHSKIIFLWTSSSFYVLTFPYPGHYASVRLLSRMELFAPRLGTYSIWCRHFLPPQWHKTTFYWHHLLYVISVKLLLQQRRLTLGCDSQILSTFTDGSA